MLKASFNKLYLVAVRGSANMDVRVAEREGKARPASIQFTTTRTEGIENEPVGTLVIDEALWKAWFSGKKLLPGMATAHEAARTMVTKNAEVYYGCPLCAFKTKDEEEHTQHVNEHINRLLQFLDLETMEEQNDKTEREESPAL